EAKANGTWLRAPNGQPSNLNPRQWVSVRTEAFKQWFGDWETTAKAVNPDSVSKVVDENGEPRVVYHGTNANAYSKDRFYIFNTNGERSGAFFSGSDIVAGRYGKDVYDTF